jgi:hypothetical protein
MKLYLISILIPLFIASCSMESTRNKGKYRFYDFDLEIDLQSSFCIDDYKYLYYGDGIKYSDTSYDSQTFDKMTLYFLTYKKCIKDTVLKTITNKVKIDTFKIILSEDQLNKLYVLSSDFTSINPSINLSKDKTPPPPPFDGYSGNILFDLKYRGNRYNMKFSFDTINSGDENMVNLFSYLEKLKNGL